MCEIEQLMAMEEQPLNLTTKKKPVAIVAPSSVLDANQNTFKTFNYNYNNNNNNNSKCNNEADDGNKNDQDEDEEDENNADGHHHEDESRPQDLSLKKQQVIDNQCKNNTKINSTNNNQWQRNDNEELRKYLFKSVVDEKNINWNDRKNDQDVQDFKTNLFKDVYKTCNHEMYGKNLSSPENNIYSMINHLAEHKFLTAWYMNSVLNMNLPYLNLSKYEGPATATVTATANSSNNNSILNNLLNKKSACDLKSAPNLDALIKNEMRATGDNVKNNPTIFNHRTQVDQKNNVDVKNNQDSNNAADKKKPHIKKPLNAFMLYMKEMRAKVVAECTLKESAAINQILGRKWHALGREEQAKYYELARRERQLHMQLYPDWSSRANATRGKKRKRKQDPADGGNSMKKCRARYGLDQQSQWCKPCSPENSSLSGGSSGVHASLLHSAGGPASAQSPQEPTYVNL